MALLKKEGVDTDDDANFDDANVVNVAAGMGVEINALNQFHHP